MTLPWILMVAEKPSLAHSIADLLADRHQVICSCLAQSGPPEPRAKDLSQSSLGSWQFAI